MQTDIVIIGSGPVGLFSIFQAGMLGMKCHIIDSLEMIGGQCKALYPEKPIYDIPAYPKITGSELIEKLSQQISPFKPTFHLNQKVIKVSEELGNFRVVTSKNTEILAKVIVIAAGCGSFGPNKPPLKGLEEFEGQSVFYSVHRRDDFIDKQILIAGGGDSAVDWAISLSEIAKKVYVVHRRDKFKAAPESVRKLKELSENGKIELVIGYQLESLLGKNGKLEFVEVSDLDGNKKSIPADVLLPFFGLSQELGPIASFGLNLKSNFITVNPTHFETSTQGIYAIGDIATYDGKLKLILTGFAEAASAMHHAYNKVFDGKSLHFEYSTTKGIKE